MKTFAIETSCDETAVALVEQSSTGKLCVHYEALYSQEQIHNTFGGVVPEIASREHLQALPQLVKSFERDSAHALDECDCIAVTVGPGLKGCLLMGMSFALGLARASGVALRAAHHIEGHLLSGFLADEPPCFPFLGLIVSGGHTEIVLASGVGSYSLLARTRDDAAGEAFDKSAKLLGLPYPGGRYLAELAAGANPGAFDFGIAMPGTMEMSFSGLKTAISRAVKNSSSEQFAEIARAAEDAIVATLVAKLSLAIQATGVTQVVLCGGVAANNKLRSEVANLPRVRLTVPELRHCTDNAAMIGAAALLREQAGIPLLVENCPVRSRWFLEELRGE